MSDIWATLYQTAPPITFVEYLAFVIVGVLIGLWVSQGFWRDK